MTSSDEQNDIMADAIHMAMCHRGHSTPTCKGDLGDAILLIERLSRVGVFLAHNAKFDTRPTRG